MTLDFVLKFLLIASMATTLGVLVMGLCNMFMSGRAAEERSNKMMRWRIILQGLAVFLFSLLLFLKAKK